MLPASSRAKKASPKRPIFHSAIYFLPIFIFTHGTVEFCKADDRSQMQRKAKVLTWPEEYEEAACVSVYVYVSSLDLVPLEVHAAERRSRIFSSGLVLSSSFGRRMDRWMDVVLTCHSWLVAGKGREGNGTGTGMCRMRKTRMFFARSGHGDGIVDVDVDGIEILGARGGGERGRAGVEYVWMVVWMEGCEDEVEISPGACLVYVLSISIV